MSNRRPDLPIPTSTGVARRDPVADAARRDVLLEASVVLWLRAGGRDPSAASRFAPIWRDWLQSTPAAQRVEHLPELGSRLAARLADPPRPPAAAFLNAFAQALLDTAVAEVEREADRAGHGAWFDSLRPCLHRDPDPAQRDDLAVRLGASPSTIALALTRLRHRLRQRIESALSAWAPDPDSRDLLRRRLRDSLTLQEAAP